MNNMKKIWSGIRSIINISKAKADYIPSILESGKTVDNPCAIANIFNNFFVNVGKNTYKNIPCGNCCPTSFLKGNFPDSMFVSPVTSVEVLHTCLKWTITKPLVPIVFQSQFLASGLRFWKLRVFVQFPLLELFVENPNRMQDLRQSYLVIFLSRQKVNLLN